MQLNAPIDARVRRLATPEGITLPFEIAGIGERTAAFLVDVVLIHAVVLVIIFSAALATGFSNNGLPLAIGLVGSFVLRNFYFIVTEMLWGGRTPAKRWLGLRVIARDGGPLTADAILARNLTRDLEVFLPLAALADPGQIVPGAPAWGALLGTLWLFAAALLPLFNRDRLRVGDLVGGTLVVRAPKATLLGDLADTAADVEQAGAAGPLRFSEAQLELYGIHELHVLEQVLRHAADPGQQEVLERVAAAIRLKIGFPESPRVDPYEFLFAFYKAQRGRLEHGLLFGRRRERKSD